MVRCAPRQHTLRMFQKSIKIPILEIVFDSYSELLFVHIFQLMKAKITSAHESYLSRNPQAYYQESQLPVHQYHQSGKHQKR